MVFKLFSPGNKVQKDKNITRRLDRELAAFGRFTLLMSGLGLGFYLVFGSLLQTARPLAVALCGLLATVILGMGYVLVNFKELYARGSARWRQGYFAVALIHAAWLSAVLCSVTLFSQSQAESTVVWLLAAAYGFIAVSIYAPYKQFCRTVLAIVFLPGILGMAAQFSAQNLLMATAIFVMLVVLINQTQKISSHFWQAHEANFLLKQKMSTLQQQKKQDSARIELNYEFVANLGQELKTALNDILGGLILLRDTDPNGSQLELINLCEKASERQLELVENIVDFAKICKKTLLIDNSVFSLRRDLEDWLDELTQEAHEYNVELNHVIQEDLPYRAKGDSARIRQVICGLVNNMIRFSQGGEIFVQVNIDKGETGSNELVVNIYDEGQRVANRGSGALFDAFSHIKHTKAGAGLGLAICKGIAECMDGHVGTSDESDSRLHYWVRLPLEVKSSSSHYFVPNLKLEGKKLLVVNAPEKIRAHLSRELSSWGLVVNCVADYRQSKAELLDAATSGEAFAALLGFTSLSDNSIVNTFQRIADNPQLPDLQQFIVASELQLQRDDWKQIFAHYSRISPVKKPLNHKVFHQLLVQRLLKMDMSLRHRGNEAAALSDQGSGKILLVEDHRVNQMVAKGMLKKLGYQAHLAKNGREALELIEKESFDLVLMDCQMAEMDGYQATQKIRQREKNRGDDECRMPIIALTAHTAEEDQSRCLAAGMDDYLAKPVRYSDLETRLRRWLGDQQSARHH